MLRRFRLLALFAVPLALGGCNGDPTAPVLTARVVSVVPSGGATGVDPNAPIVVTFSHVMQAGMQYTVHLGGGMRATDGGFVDYGSCVGQHSGQWATRAMVGGGVMGGGNMMGSGWRHPNGTYGMVFTFTTA